MLLWYHVTSSVALVDLQLLYIVVRQAIPCRLAAVLKCYVKLSPCGHATVVSCYTNNVGPGWTHELGSWITIQLIQAYYQYGVGSNPAL